MKKSKYFFKLFIAVFGFMALTIAPFSAYSDHDLFDGLDQERVTICHATGNSGYEIAITPNIHGTGGNINLQGHDQHQDNRDIIPPFHYDGGTYPGQNWNSDTAQIWNDGGCDGEVQPVFACSDEVDNDEDDLSDILDPGCHQDGDVDNEDSYNPNDNDETDPAPVYECSDNVDNSDTEDTLADELDPGCWTNPNDSGTYIGTDNDETTPTDVCPNDAGIQTNTSECTVPSVYACSDDTDNDGDNLADELDPGCHSDGNASNSSSYVSTDNSEVGAPANQAPLANAGPDKAITLPVSTSAPTDTSATDSDGTISSMIWSFVSGPITAIVTNETTLTPTFSGMTSVGTYVFKLTVTDNEGATDVDEVTIVVNPVVVLPVCSDDADNDNDNLIDELDPGCHTDGNVNNTNSYNPNDDSELEPISLPQCSDDADNDDDSLIDELDPSCHTDGNANNPNSYDPNDNDELEPTSLPQCSDNVDNSDTEDTLADELDPGCWTNPNDSGTYIGTDNDETTPTDVCPNDAGIQTNTSECTVPSVYACSDDTDNDGDNLADELDPGCHSDGNASNSSSYVSTDNSEVDAPVYACSDGQDNDQDGETDYPNDSGCENATDNDETNSSNRRSSGGGSRRVVSAPVGQVLGAETSCGIYVDKFLRKGYENNPEAVKKVQIFLNVYENSGLVVDGIYGSKTESAVSKFQLEHKDKILTPWNISAPTGIFYLTTQTEMNNIMCPTLGLPIPNNLIPFKTHPQAPIALDTIAGNTVYRA